MHGMKIATPAGLPGPRSAGCRSCCPSIIASVGAGPGRGAAPFTLLRRAGTHAYVEPPPWAPDQQRTTPQMRRAAQHPGRVPHLSPLGRDLVERHVLVDAD